MATTVAPGGFSRVQTGPSIAEQAFRTTVSFCRVAATLTPSADSEIKIEVWLPTARWNGELQAVGNGGWNGSINYPGMSDALARGYATASTDTGHVGDTAAFALGHPEKLIDNAYRSEHEMTVHAKSIVDVFYGRQPRLSIWNGCSTGGRQAITEASRYPADYDAVIAGAPAIYSVERRAAKMALNAFANRDSTSAIPPDKYAMLHRAVLEACDAEDGLKDGLIGDPRSCRFDPTILQCEGDDRASCLTPAQVETARALYAPVKHPQSHAIVSEPLLLPGSELGWAVVAGPQPERNLLEAFKYLVFKDPNWDWHSFNPATDFDRALASNMDLYTTDPNVMPFFARGGKLLMYHGWADNQISPLTTLRYFNEVLQTVGNEAAGRSIALYLAPGMGHCRGGEGPNTFDTVDAIEDWVEKGHAPGSITATHSTAGRIDRRRPLCPFPQTGRYRGAGSIDDATNFVCAGS